jgi:hypothetical protein
LPAPPARCGVASGAGRSGFFWDSPRKGGLAWLGELCMFYYLRRGGASIREGVLDSEFIEELALAFEPSNLPIEYRSLDG